MRHGESSITWYLTRSLFSKSSARRAAHFQSRSSPRRSVAYLHIRVWLRSLAMRVDKRRKLEAAGWKVGDAAEFLGLSESESEFVEIKLALARRLRELREKRN